MAADYAYSSSPALLCAQDGSVAAIFCEKDEDSLTLDSIYCDARSAVTQAVRR
jgi:hypothetical protein